MEVGERLTLVFKGDTLKAEGALLRIQSRLSALGSPSSGFSLDGKPIDDVLSVKKLEKPHFNLIGRGYEFDLGKVRNCDLDFLLIKSVREQEWDDWMAPFLEISGFTMAWVSDIAYEFWQTADDPLEYQASNKSIDGLPMKSNGLPYPLEQAIIDTSRNPGRRVIRRGYYEVVGSVMWLGESFWQLTGSDRGSIENAGWIQVSHPANTVLRIQVSERCFNRSDDGSEEIQRRLRSLLFPELRTEN